MVWADNRNGNWDIYVYDLATSTLRQLTTNVGDQEFPRISGRRVVWEDYRNQPSQIWTLDLDSGGPEPVSPSPTGANQVLPAIDNEKIVWTEPRYGHFDIFMFTIMPPECGDGYCNGDEDCHSCPQDCGNCLPECGDGTCNGNETCATCPHDCGVCPPCGESSWQLLGSGMNGNIWALTVYNGQLIAGGWFSTAGGVDANYVARWDGTNWHPLGSGMRGPVEALTVYSGDLIAGESFTTANRFIARWNGNSWQPLGSGMNDDVRALAIYNGQLIAGGRFTKAGGADANYIARWDGSSWQPLGSGVDRGGDNVTFVKALTVYNDHGVKKLIAGGNFTIAGGAAANYIAQWNGSNWQPLGSGMNSLVDALAVYNGELIAGGYFITAGGVITNYIARWDGSNWQPLGSGIYWGNVNALTVYNGQLIAGGWFSKAGGVDANNVAQWDGSSWQALGGGVNNQVSALTVYNGRLIAGGYFTTAGGEPAACIARWGPPTVIEGDLNHDCSVDETDLGLFAQRWIDEDCLYNGWCYEADLNYDTRVDFLDYVRLAYNWLEGI